MRLVLAGGFKSPAFVGLDSTESPHAPLAAWKWPGAWNSRPCCPDMTASDSTPCEGESATGECYDWEAVGRRLLRAELELRAQEVRDSFLELAQLVDAGEEIGPDDIADIDEAVAQARFLVESVRDGDRTARELQRALRGRLGDEG